MKTGTVITVMKLLYGERIGKTGELAISCVGVLFTPDKTKVLLVRRTDNQQWCLPGGFMQAGETIAEACEREVWEETGLTVQTNRFIGLYSNPNILATYDDGRKFHVVVAVCEVEVVKGQLATSDETTQINFFSLGEIKNLGLANFHQEQIQDGFAFHANTLLK
ncbi:MAG: NUDIX domain-containing protein [bacterium]|nr:NUDIX domain-containing protein [bacterium]